MTKIACVIVTYNRKKLLMEALQSVLSQKESPEYIVLVDNASTDGTRELVSKKYDINNSKIKYFRSKKNLGGSAGFAYGMREALKLDCDWISISDDDAIFTPNYFSEIRKSINANPEQLVFSGSVLLPNGKHDMMHREMITNKVTLTTRPIAEDKYTEDFMYDVFSFVGVVLKRELIEKIGFPEQSYFIRFDDFEYALRALQYGQFLNVHKAIVLHKTTYTKKSVAAWKEYYVMRNRIASLLKHSGKNWETELYIKKFLIRKILAIMLFKNRWKQALPLLKAYLCGYEDGMKNRLGRNTNYLP